MITLKFGVFHVSSRELALLRLNTFETFLVDKHLIKSEDLET